MASHKGSGSRVDQPMEKCMIVAVADDLAIGRAGDLPWHIREDLRYFRRVTTGFPVIMGRTTYESIGRPLPGRTNIVLTRSDVQIPGCVCVHSLEEAYEAAEPAERCFVMGGASVYARSIGDMDRLYVTQVHTVIPDADAWFPQMDPKQWIEESRTETLADPESGVEFEFVVYRKA